MKILLIGMGSIGKKHFSVFSGHGCHIDSYDPFEIEATFNSEKDVDFSSYDAYIVSSPSDTHLHYLEMLICFDKPIFVEKPLVTSEEELNKVIDIDDGNRIVSACNLFFYWPILKLKELMDMNILGDIYSADFYFCHDLSQQRDNIRSYALDSTSCGCWLDVASHELAIIYKLFPGNHNEFSYSIGNRKYGFKDESVKAIFKVDNRTLLSLNMDLLSKVRRRGCVVVGEKGVFEWREVGKPPVVNVTVHYTNESFDTFYPADNKSMFEKQAVEFLKFCNHQIDNFYPLDEAISTTKVILKHKNIIDTIGNGN